jgi:ATP-dependent Clp protease ATP-binding subunit ClpC
MKKNVSRSMKEPTSRLDRPLPMLGSVGKSRRRHCLAWLSLALPFWLDSSLIVSAFPLPIAPFTLQSTNARSVRKDAFVPIGGVTTSTSRSSCGNRFAPGGLARSHRSTTRLFVFERMSEDCIAALVSAQTQTSRLQLPEVGCATMMAGVVDHPESAALVRTLQQYGIVYRKVPPTLDRLFAGDGDDDGTGGTEQQQKGWLSGFRAAKRDEDRPFGKDLKRTLVQAGKLADQMGSTTVGSQHVFLALLEYSESGGGKDKAPASAATLDPDSDECGGWAVLVKMNVLDDTVTALDVCESLLQNMADQPDQARRELVTGAGGSGKMPTLTECGVDLTQQAEDGLLDPVYGRDDETRACVRTLIRRRKNNVCLIGEPGVGKTAIAEGVAQILVDEKLCPARLKGHRLFSLELSNLVAGTKYRGEFEERLQSIIKEVTDPKAPPTILFIDEIHNLVGAGAAEGGMDAANLLKPALARGELQLIGATTIMEYRKYIEKDAALERRLQPVMVKEPSVVQTIDILQAVQSNYEKHHGVTYTSAALNAAATLSDRYMTDRFLPDKALDLLDEAGAIAHLEEPDEDVTPEVTEHTVAMVISEWSGIPMGKLETQEMDRLQALEGEMGRRVKGQGRAIRGVARAVRRARSGLRDPRRPVASFLFCGPTGTGKTELCKTLAETYYGSEKDMIRIDMSEYMEKHSVSRLTGPPPGYIGYEEGGQLTEAVRRAPHSVVLLDELEKAHGDVLNILLQVMEDGMLTDGKGRTINFKNSILVMTSNVGSRRILEVARSGSGASGAISTRPIPVATASADTMSIEPMKPEEILKKMQSNPEAASLLLEASSDPKIMGAIRTAMNGSPADLLKSGREDPEVAKFLQRLWGVLQDEKPLANGDSKRPKSGLETIRNSFEDTVSEWTETVKDRFATSVIDQMSAAQHTGDSIVQKDHYLYAELAQVVKEELEREMKPELLNRIDEIIVFSPLSTGDLRMIAELIVAKISERALKEQKLELKIDRSVIERVMAEGSANADQFGARPMRRAAQRFVEDSLSDAIIQGFLQEGEGATVSLASKASAKEKERVIITRTRDGSDLMIEVEDADGGIGSVPPAPSASMEAPRTNGLSAASSLI